MRYILAFLALGLFLLIGCDDNTNNPQPVSANLRMINMVYDGGALDVYVNGKLATSGTTFGQSSGYKQVSVGELDVAVHQAGESQPRNSSKQSLAEGGSYTVIAFPPSAAFAAAFVADGRQVGIGKSRIKLANCTNDQNVEYELWLTGAQTKLLGPVRRVTVSHNADLIDGTYSFSLKRKGDSTFEVNYAPIVLQSQTSYTFIVHGTSRTDDAYPFGVRVFNDGGNGDTFVDLTQSAATSNVEFINAVVGAGQIDVAINATSPQVKGLAFGSSTPYLSVAAGQGTYTAAMGNTALVSNRSINLVNGKKYSVFLIGAISPLSAGTLELTDEVTADPSTALVRFIHLSPEAPKLNVITTIPTDYPVPGMQNMSYRQVSTSPTSGSNFLRLPAGTYSMKFREPDSTANYYSQENVTFENGRIYTMWLGGNKTSGNLKVYVVNHN